MKATHLLFLVASLVVGVMLGDAFAGPQFNPAVPPLGDTPPPNPRPAALTYATTIGYAFPADTINEIFVGRDDTSPYCGFTATSGGGVTFGTPWTVSTLSFFYRPLWDVSLTPNYLAQSSADFTAHWTAVQTVADTLDRNRSAMNFPFPPGPPLPRLVSAYYILIVVDSNVGTNTPRAIGTAPNANEFYKFEISH